MTARGEHYIEIPAKYAHNPKLRKQYIEGYFRGYVRQHEKLAARKNVPPKTKESRLMRRLRTGGV